MPNKNQMTQYRFFLWAWAAGLTIATAAHAATDVAFNKNYQVSRAPYTTGGVSSYYDIEGPEDFSETCRWYRGELTDGTQAASSYGAAGWVCFHQSGQYSITLDLGALYTITSIKVQAYGGGNYDGVRFPTRIRAYALPNLGPAMPYEKFCETMEVDDQDWTLLGEIESTFVEDGSSYFSHLFEITFPSAQTRLVKLIFNDRTPTFLGELMIYSNDNPPPAGNIITLIDFPPEGRDVFFPVNLTTTNAYADRTGFALGVHAGMDDSPFGWRRPMMETIRDNPVGMHAQGTACINQVGIRALRFYDTWNVNYRSWIEQVKVFNHFNGTNYSIPPSDEGYSFPYYDEIIDYCAAENYLCVMVLDTWYYDPVLDRVYSTREVANNCPDDPADPHYTTDPNDPAGILYLAAQRNAAPIAQYYHNQAYNTRLILEIGNEGIGRHTNLSPDGPQYARIIKAFSDAVKAVAPEVETAPYLWPDLEIIDLVAAIGAPIDHLVTHPYSLGPDAIKHHLDTIADALDAVRLNHVPILITEYSRDLWSPLARTYSMGLEQCWSELIMGIHPRVSGMMEHCLFNTAKAIHSDMRFWSVRGSYGAPPDHPADQHPEYRRRFAILPSGMVGNLLEKTLQGHVIKYWPGTNSKIAGMMTQQDTQKRLFLLNWYDSPVELRWTGTFTIEKQYLLTGTAEQFVHLPQQPWSIVETVPTTPPDTIAPKSILLLELDDQTDFNLDGFVNLGDFSTLAAYWLDSVCLPDDWCQGVDVDKSGQVDFADLLNLVEDWLTPAAPAGN